MSLSLVVKFDKLASLQYVTSDWFNQVICHCNFFEKRFLYDNTKHHYAKTNFTRTIQIKYA